MGNPTLASVSKWNTGKVNSCFILKESNNLQKINDSVGYEMQCFLHHGIPLSVIQEKNLNCKVHQDMKLNAGL